MGTILVLDTDISSLEIPTTDMVGPIDIVNYTSDNSLIEAIESELGTAHRETIPAAGRLDDIAVELRAEYTRFINSIPDQVQSGPGTLRDMLVFEDQLSCWWLNVLSAKRSDSQPTFTAMCRLELLSSVVDDREIDEAYVFTDDEAFETATQELFQNRNVTPRTSATANRIKSQTKDTLRFCKAVSDTILWLWTVIVSTVLLRLRGHRQGTVPEDTRSVVNFTLYPHVWKETDTETCDEKYTTVPSRCGQQEGVTSFYLASLNDGYHQQPGLRELLRRETALTEHIETQNGISQAFILDAYTTPRSLWKTLKSLSVSWQYYNLLWSTRLEKACEFRGISLVPFVRQELRAALYNTPKYILHALRTRTFIEQTNPDTLVTYNFEFCDGRAVIYGVRTGCGQTDIVGVQHGPISRRKLMYYHGSRDQPGIDTREYIDQFPAADTLVLEGKGAKSCLQEAGYPESRLIVAGAPRLSELLEVPLAKPTSAHNQTTILVGFSQSDGAELLSSIRLLTENDEIYHFILKPHPRSDFGPAEIEDSLPDDPTVTFELTTDRFYDILPGVDVLLTTYSSVGPEAALRKYPVVCLQLPSKINGSPLLELDISGVSVSPADRSLCDAIATLEKTADVKKVQQYCFAYFDDNPVNHWIDAILSTSSD